MRRKILDTAAKVYLILAILLGMALITFFIYNSVRFNKKVEIFKNEIIIGMKEEEVVRLLGNPNFEQDRQYNMAGKKLSEVTGKSDMEFYELTYSGMFTLRDDLRLYFDKRTKTLVFKEQRGTTFGRIHY
jgi:hypothetical protein